MTTQPTLDTDTADQPVTLDELAALCATRRMTYAEARDYLDGKRVPPPQLEPLMPVSDAELDILEMRAYSPFGLTKHEVRRVIHALKEGRATNAIRRHEQSERIGRLRCALRHMLSPYITGAAAVATGKEALENDDKARNAHPPDESRKAPELTPAQLSDLDALEHAIEDICGDNDELMRAITLLKLEYKNGTPPAKFPFTLYDGTHYRVVAAPVRSYPPITILQK